MKREFRKSMSKTLATLVATTVLIGNITTYANPGNINVYSNEIKEVSPFEITEVNPDERVNLVKDPGFEEDPNIDDYEIPYWTTIGNAGNWNNYPHTGKVQCWLDPGSSNIIKQTITAPYNGYYTGAAYVAAGGPNGKLALFNSQDGSIVQEVTVDSNSSYIKYKLQPIYLNKGDKIDIGLIGGSAWVNGDDFEFYYDRSNPQNILSDGEFDNGSSWEMTNVEIKDGIAILKDGTSQISQKVQVPNQGYYYLDLDVKAISDNVVVKVGDKEEKLMASDAFNKIRISGIELDKNEELSVTIIGQAEVKSANFMYDIEKMNFIKPEASNVTISGNTEVDAVLNATYDFSDADNHVEGNTQIRWLISDSADGQYTEIPGQTGNRLIIQKDLENKYVKCEIIAVDEYGIAGNATLSEAVGPIDVNIIYNPSFENSGLGWRYYGANIRTNYSYDGGIRARIARGTFNHITQEIVVPESGIYDLSAWVSSASSGAKMGLMTLADDINEREIIVSKNITTADNYINEKITDLYLEKGEKIKLFFSGAETALVSVDNVKLIRNRQAEARISNNIIAFKIKGQEGNTILNKNSKNIKVVVPYGTNVSKLTIENIVVSEGAAIGIKNGDKLDLSKPIKLAVSDKNGEKSTWTISCEVERKEAVVKSSNAFLQESFNWAVDKTEQFVMTGKTGLINRDERNNDGTGIAKYIPSYWAGYYDRTAFYGRDFVHQATGGQIAGLKDENFSMFKTFAQNATEARKWYTLWAINFDGSPHTIDYYNDNVFVREVPAQFELVEKAYEQYLWTGDERYINDTDMWNFYTKVMTDFIGLHDDQNPNGIAEGYGGIFQGSCTYNERGENPIEAGDAIGAQYQATLAYAGMLEARGENVKAEKWYEKAEELKKYFNEDWSIIEGDSEGYYARILDKDGNKKNDFGKENSWFMPMKLITEPGQRNNNYLDFISEKLGNGIGTAPEAPWNIEAYTYIPETYFPYNRNEEAWKWMKYIMSEKDNPHERPQQGTNGDYPEISFTFVSNTVEGMMGVEPNAAGHAVVTAPRLPKDVQWLNLSNLSMGDHELNIEHNGLTMTTLTNKAAKDLKWQARFYGNYKFINVNGELVKAKQKKINGEVVSYANVKVKANATVSVEATNKSGK